MRNQSLARIAFGSIIVLIGLGFLLDTLGVADFSHIAGNWWPLLIIIGGLLSLMSNPRVFVWPLAIVAAGILILLKQLDVVNFNIWQLIWPALVITFGVNVLLNNRQSAHAAGQPDRRFVHDRSMDNLFVLFSGTENRNTNQDYHGGKLTAIFGGIDLDLREAAIKDTADIQVFTAFGGATLHVPENWEVHADGLPLFGGWDNKAHKPTNGQAPLLAIHGTSIFGGVEIKN